MNLQPKYKQIIPAAACLALALTGSSLTAATVLNYPDFSSTAGLQLNGNAAKVGNVVRVTPSTSFQSGSVFSTSAVTLNANVSFSTFFSFRMSNPGGIGDNDGQGADGMVFVVQTNSNSVGGAGGGIGYDGVPNSVGIEFDSYDNGPGSGDPDGNHVSIDTNGSLASGLSSAVSAPDLLNNGNIWYAWVDYDGTSDLLEVRLSSSVTRPAAALTSATLDLPSILGSSNAFVGFTSGTGSGYNDHDVLSWEFRDDYQPVTNPPTHGVPDAGGTFAMLGLAVSALGFFSRKAVKGAKA